MIAPPEPAPLAAGTVVQHFSYTNSLIDNTTTEFKVFVYAPVFGIRGARTAQLARVWRPQVEFQPSHDDAGNFGRDGHDPQPLSPGDQHGPPTSTNVRGEVTRREFVATIGVITGGVALGVPGLTSEHLTKVISAEPQSIAARNVVPLVLTINGEKHELSLDPRVTLLDLLREDLKLTGTKKGCDHGQCGACTVLANGTRISSCLTLAVTHDGEEITTIEGIAQGEQLHPLQAAFLEHDGFQCGYCTPGQICSGVALLREAQRGDLSFVTENLHQTGPANLTPDEIRERMSGNICRCGAYPGIVAAVEMVYGRVQNTSKLESAS